MKGQNVTVINILQIGSVYRHWSCFAFIQTHLVEVVTWRFSTHNLLSCLL